MRQLLLVLVLSAAAAACSQNNNVTVTIGPVTGTPVFHCVGLTAGDSPACGTATWSITRYDPLVLLGGDAAAADTVALEIVASSPTGHASACLRHFSGGFLSAPTTLECADSGTLMLSSFPASSADPMPSGTVHLHFPDGGTIDSTF